MSKHKQTKKNNDFIGPLNFSKGAYLESTSRPLYALFFLLPLVGLYEVGTVLVEQLSNDPQRLVAFNWLIKLADWIGMQHVLAKMFPGFIVIIILLCWQMSSQHSWKVKPRWLCYMTLECILLTLPLFALDVFLNTHITTTGEVAIALTPDSVITSTSYWSNIVTGIGAGIYEELIFRIIILGLILMLFEDVFKFKTSYAFLAAAILSCLFFAMYHHIGISFSPFRTYTLESMNLRSFLFRALAGLYFAYIFKYRGYGIIAGTHSFFDIIVFTCFIRA